MALTVALTSVSAEAAVIRVPSASFVAGAGVTTFDGSGTNPSYNPSDYGGGAGSPVVQTGGWFLGQSLSATPGVDCPGGAASACVVGCITGPLTLDPLRSEEHTSELQSLMRISYAVFCLKKKHKQ